MIKFLIVLCLLLGSSFNTLAEPQPFSFLLASSFDPEKHDLSDYYLSEKLDGVRAYWDGHALLSRGGQTLAAPPWFLNALPKVALDGELWGGRRTFDEVSGIVRRAQPHDGWRKVTFMAFELPQAEGDFSARYQALQRLYARHGNQHWRVVEQRAAPKSLAKLESLLIKLDSEGGEGYMLKAKSADYRGGRSDDLLKVKLKNDAEARVVAHHKGNGRLATMMGSMTVEMPNGIRFKLGSGFTDLQRESPPEVGSIVTYKYNGLTNNGKPRFPVFWRIRSDAGL